MVNIVQVALLRSLSHTLECLEPTHTHTVPVQLDRLALHHPATAHAGTRGDKHARVDQTRHRAGGDAEKLRRLARATAQAGLGA